MALKVHLGHEELHVLFEVGADDLFGAFRDLVAFLIEPGDQAIGFLRRQDQDVVLSDFVFGFDGHAEVFRFHHFVRHSAGSLGCGHSSRHFTVVSLVARILVMVFDKARRCVLVEMVDQPRIGDIDLLFFRHVHHRNDHREFLDIAAEIRGHGDDRAVPIAHQRHLGGVIEEICIRLGDKEAAKG